MMSSSRRASRTMVFPPAPAGAGQRLLVSGGHASALAQPLLRCPLDMHRFSAGKLLATSAGRAACAVQGASFCRLMFAICEVVIEPTTVCTRNVDALDTRPGSGVLASAGSHHDASSGEMLHRRTGSSKRPLMIAPANGVTSKEFFFALKERFIAREIQRRGTS